MRRDEHPVRRVNPGGAVRWIARYTDSSGKRQSAGTYAKEGPCKKPHPQGECCARHRILHMYEAATPRDAGAETVRSYYSHWLKDHPRPVRTEAGYTSRVKAILATRVGGKPFGDWPLRELKRKQLAALVDVMLRVDGRAASGTRAVISVLSTMFEDAITDDVMDANPALGVRIRESDPRVQRPRRKALVVSWAEMHAFARAAGEFEPMVRVLSDCGLRLGEMLALEATHDCRDTLLVENNAWRGVVSPGTKQSDGRTVPIPPGLRLILDAYATPLRGPLFPMANGKAWPEWAFYERVWQPAQKRSGLMLRPHDLRHSFVSLMRAAGVDPADLADATGHTTATAFGYTHSTGATFDAMREAVG